MRYSMDLSGFTNTEVRPLGEDFSGQSANGTTLRVNSYYMEKDGKPFFGISGEFHYSRMDSARWEDELIKMRLGGVNVVSTYLFWNHIEEQEGVFDFSGRRDVRRFVQLCAKHGLYVILRVGPFYHGEVRNGGMPDWLYGKPFEVRTTDKEFLRYVRRLYTKIGEQVQGLFFSDGGPVIAVQLDNEYMHSSAAWEITNGISDEFIFVGDEGEKYMLALRDLAGECGLTPVFYTSTAWGGAPVSRRILPLWGGYPYRPWIFYSHKGEHPATEEYIYEDYHHKGAVWADDFVPTYDPESYPYACCEMGGGMMCCYYYRFIYPYKSVDALANIKLASGCNFIGYYMFQGGTNPIGKNGTYLNESQVPKLSYDYQAALGEFGQVRESYRRLKALHYFASCYADRLCGTETVLPEGASAISPEDLQTLRYAVRTDGKRGFLFLNNFQDHREMPDREGEIVEIALPGETLRWEISIAGDENAILPFHFDLDGIELVQACAQPVLRTEAEGKTLHVFMVPDGMKPSFRFEEGTEIVLRSSGKRCSGTVAAEDLADFRDTASLTVRRGENLVEILLVSRSRANDMYLLRDGSLVFTDQALLEDEQGNLRLETTAEENVLRCLPAGRLEKNLEKDMENGHGATRLPDEGALGCYRVWVEPVRFSVSVADRGHYRYVLQAARTGAETADQDLLCGLKDARLRIRYEGDIGALFLDDVMISDNFCNGDVWEIGLLEHRDKLPQLPMVLKITPLREGANVNVESTMAGRHEEADSITGRLLSAEVQAVYEIGL